MQQRKIICNVGIHKGKEGGSDSFPRRYSRRGVTYPSGWNKVVGAMQMHAWFVEGKNGKEKDVYVQCRDYFERDRERGLVWDIHQGRESFKIIEFGHFERNRIDRIGVTSSSSLLVLI